MTHALDSAYILGTNQDVMGHGEVDASKACVACYSANLHSSTMLNKG